MAEVKETVKKTYTQEEFQKMYLQLCVLTGWQHGGTPIFRTLGQAGSVVDVEFTIIPYKEAQ
jgi:hypothetical protein